MKHRPAKRLIGTAVTTLFVAMAMMMAGCSGPGDADEKASNDAPHAVLDVNKNTGFTDEGFTFDGTKSNDDDGDIVEYRFDFGDGVKFVATDDDQARPTHVYAEGGEYTVTLTVVDDGHDKAGAESDMTTKTVAVNQRIEVPQSAVFAAPTGGNQTSMNAQPFEVRKDADRIEVHLEATGAVPAGESRIEVKVMDADGDQVAREEHTIGASQNATFDLSDISLNNDEGTWQLQVLAHSGGATYDGNIEVYYDAGYVQ